MRVTNAMITRNSMTNINSNKINLDKYDKQMTNQKKISRASEDPVVAIRALRLRTTLSEINQYYEKNIPDAESWLEVTESSLENMVKLMDDMKEQCTHGANDTLNQQDRKSLLDSLTSISEQLYHELNSNDSDRTVFSGYKTDKTVTFDKNEKDMEYSISEKLSYKDIQERNYYANKLEVPSGKTEVNVTTIPTPENGKMMSEETRNRIRLAYDQTESGINKIDNFAYTYMDSVSNVAVKIAFEPDAANPGNYKQVGYKQTVDADGKAQFDDKGNPVFAEDASVITNASATLNQIDYSDWEKAGYPIGDDEILYIPDTGELIIGKNIENEFISKHADIDVDYTKKGFNTGDIRPEMYFNCTDKTNPKEPIVYTKVNQEIQYNVAFNQKLTINTQASDFMGSGVARDIGELKQIVQAAIDAHDKLDKIQQMKKEVQFSDEESQKNLALWEAAAEKEIAYADANLQKRFGQGITDFTEASNKVVLARTEVGNRGSRLALTKTRMESQQSTFKDLKTENEDREISEIIIDHTQAYNAYQSSLIAASKATETTLLNYI